MKFATFGVGRLRAGPSREEHGAQALRTAPEHRTAYRLVPWPGKGAVETGIQREAEEAEGERHLVAGGGEDAFEVVDGGARFGRTRRVHGAGAGVLAVVPPVDDSVRSRRDPAAGGRRSDDQNVVAPPSERAVRHTADGPGDVGAEGVLL